MFHKKLKKHINQALEAKGIESPIALQKKTISAIKSGLDTIILSDRKSGKTTAMAISLIQMLNYAQNDVPRAMIIVPDKDRADKLEELFNELGSGTDLRVNCVYPGPGLEKVRDKVYFGTDIVVGTLKRLNELYSNSGLNLNDLSIFIIDDGQECMKAEMMAGIDRLVDIRPNTQRIILTERINDTIQRFADTRMTRMNLIKE